MFQESDPNFKACTDFAFSNIYNSKYTSVNSHEIRRHIDGLAERFEISNYKRYGDRLKELCTAFSLRADCKEHCETDIEWKILSFLLHISRNPIDGVIANDREINLNALKKEVSSSVDEDDVKVVKEDSDFVEQEFSDSDLSVSIERVGSIRGFSSNILSRYGQIMTLKNHKMFLVRKMAVILLHLG